MSGHLFYKRSYISTTVLFVCVVLFAFGLSSKRAIYDSLLLYRDSGSSRISYFSPNLTNYTSDFFTRIPEHVILNSSRGSVTDSEPQSTAPSVFPYPAVENTTRSSINLADGCNLYVGKWLKDEGYPLYKHGACPYVDEAFNCQRNGRPDSEYEKWGWKPDGCDLPRFNAFEFLWRLRGKRLMLVGDSMNRNQFESMLCLLHAGLHDKGRMHEIHGYALTKGRGYFVFEFTDFNCTIEYLRSHFLVKEGTQINGQGDSRPTLAIDQIDKSAGRWKKADVLMFNSGHWWTHGKPSRGKNYYKEGDHVYPQLEANEAYHRALRTWANWIDHNINPARQIVFYRGYSSAHFRGGDWDSGGTCRGERDPILGGRFLDDYPLRMKMVEEVIQRMRVPVVLLNITHLTNARKDGHPSVYRSTAAAASATGKKLSSKRQDCSHWCLPGVPDAWNELIYACLVLNSSHTFHP